MQALKATYDGLAPWLVQQTGITGARIAGELTGGNANVTRLVESDRGRIVLRHAPVDMVSENAGAGIAREYRFVKAIADHAPVAEPLAFCEDREIIGTPFALYAFVEGVAITDTLPSAYLGDPDSIDALGMAMMDAIAKVHAFDPVPRDLGDIEKARTFVPRQVARWQRERRENIVRDLPELDRLGAWLMEHAPEPETVRISHCDFHLDNILVDERAPRVRAILDWEMATLADPLVDVGLATAFWNRDEKKSPGFAFVQRVSNRPGVVGGGELAAHWAARTGLSVQNLTYYQVFTLWRLAAIVEGAFVLHERGKVQGDYERGLKDDVPALLDQARCIAASVTTC